MAAMAMVLATNTFIAALLQAELIEPRAIFAKTVAYRVRPGNYGTPLATVFGGFRRRRRISNQH